MSAIRRPFSAGLLCLLAPARQIPREGTKQLSSRCLHRPSAPLLRRALPITCQKPNIIHQLRHESNGAPRPLTDRTADTPGPNKEREEPPSYQMTFTCRKCAHRSTHKISKQGYHHGTILVTCPGCKNRHLISDHLQIFSDKAVTLEDIMREKGQMIRKGTLGGDGDVEFWDDAGDESKPPEK